MVIKPDIDVLLSKVDSKYTLCIVSARRARQINDMTRTVRERQLLATVQSSEIAEMLAKKPLTKALEEIEDGTITYERDERVSASYK